MRPPFLYILPLIAALVIGIAIASFVIDKPAAENTEQPAAVAGAADYKNAEYLIDGRKIRLIDGFAEESAAPDSASKITTRYFGNELKTDLNNDGREDIVFLLIRETGGSGTFFYAVAALNTENGWLGSDGYLLGDRIAPQTTNLSPNPRHKNVIVVNYADRAEGEPMTARPSVGKSVYLKLNAETMQWGIVMPDFEGESDLIHLFLPKAGAEISSPLEITGEARGMWFFEASFPVFLVDWDGKIIAQGIATAQSDPDDSVGAGWMTEDFVPFKAKLEFSVEKDIYSRNGALILKKDNPSGLPEKDDALEIPVVFR